MMNNPIGVLIHYTTKTDIRAQIKKAQELELGSFQLCIWDMKVYDDEKYALDVKSALEETGFLVTSVWAGWTGPQEWNFRYGPSTLGLVPEAYRFQRAEEVLKASEFAQKIGVKNIITHAGFIPENPDHPDFTGVVSILRYICGKLKSRGQNFLFETGQETPVTMLRTIQAIGGDNVGINFDTANLIAYGKANSVDALDTYGKYIMDTHIKDAVYPTDGNQLGHETPAGEGKANFEVLIPKLRDFGYTGPFTIEREIEGEQQIADIIRARDMLRDIMSRN